MMKEVWMEIYKDTTGLFTKEECDDNNLIEMKFPEEIVRAYFKENKDEDIWTFEGWLAEYTADETTGLFYFAQDHAKYFGWEQLLVYREVGADLQYGPELTKRTVKVRWRDEEEYLAIQTILVDAEDDAAAAAFEWLSHFVEETFEVDYDDIETDGIDIWYNKEGKQFTPIRQLEVEIIGEI